MGSGARAASGSMTAESAAHFSAEEWGHRSQNLIVAEKPCYKER